MRQGGFKNIGVCFRCINCTNIFLERGAARGSKQAPAGLRVYSLDTTLLSCTLNNNIRGVTSQSMFLCPCMRVFPFTSSYAEMASRPLHSDQRVLYSTPLPSPRKNACDISPHVPPPKAPTCFHSPTSALPLQSSLLYNYSDITSLISKV